MNDNMEETAIEKYLVQQLQLSTIVHEFIRSQVSTRAGFWRHYRVHGSPNNQMKIVVFSGERNDGQ